MQLAFWCAVYLVIVLMALRIWSAMKSDERRLVDAAMRDLNQRWARERTPVIYIEQHHSRWQKPKRQVFH